MWKAMPNWDIILRGDPRVTHSNKVNFSPRLPPAAPNSPLNLPKDNIFELGTVSFQLHHSSSSCPFPTSAYESDLPIQMLLSACTPHPAPDAGDPPPAKPRIKRACDRCSYARSRCKTGFPWQVPLSKGAPTLRVVGANIDHLLVHYMCQACRQKPSDDKLTVSRAFSFVMTGDVEHEPVPDIHAALCGGAILILEL